MEVRLNKVISDAGICSRREADKFIEMGRVTVNTKRAKVGQRVTENDEVLVDGELLRIKWASYVEAGKDKPITPSGTRKDEAGNTDGRREHYGRYNKYAAARKAAKERGEEPHKGKPKLDRDKVWQEATQPKFGKSLSRSAVAQRMAASPKSAALRKTSRNNPINKAKRNGRRE